MKYVAIAHLSDGSTEELFTDEWYARHPSYQRLSPQTESHTRFVVENHLREKGIQFTSVEIVER
jgi:hypothetical protein